MDKLARMSTLGDLAQEQQEEDARCIMDAEEVAWEGCMEGH